MAVSPQMQARLDKIQNLVDQGYTVSRKWESIPVLKSSEGLSRNLINNGPAGFSWIGFFFPFAVCTQIREWSYFAVYGISCLLISFITSIIGGDLWWLEFIVDVAYGFFYPYLRFMAIKKDVKEIDRLPSILLGFTLFITINILAFTLIS